MVTIDLCGSVAGKQVTDFLNWGTINFFSSALKLQSRPGTIEAMDDVGNPTDAQGKSFSNRGIPHGNC